MKVALYTPQLAPEGPSGVHRYVSEIGRALFEQHPDRYRMLCSAEVAPPIWPPGAMPIVRLPGPRRALHLSWWLTGRPRIDRYIDGSGLLHVLHPSFPVPSKVPLVYTFHDLFPFEHPNWYTREARVLFKAAARDAAARAARVIAVSSYVADAVTALLSIERERIDVIPCGIGERFRTVPSPSRVEDICRRFGVEPGRFFLYVGAINLRKNLNVLIQAIARRGPGARLLIAGGGGVESERARSEISMLGLDTDVLMSGRVSDEDLPALMTGAIALLFPSKEEGFGLPPLEAMALGTPAIASRSGALPETLGDAAVLLDPENVDEWAAAMTRVENDGTHALRLAEEGRRRASRYTWERAARETAAVHEAVFHGG